MSGGFKVDVRDHYEFDPYNFAQVVKEIFYDQFHKHPQAGDIDDMNSNDHFVQVFIDTNKSAAKIRARIAHLYKRQNRDKERYDIFDIAMAFWKWIVHENLPLRKAEEKTMKQVKGATKKWLELSESLDLENWENVTSESLLEALNT